jgi:hypothetical protein
VVQVQPPHRETSPRYPGGLSDPTKPFDIEELEGRSAAVGLAQALGLGPLLRCQVLRPISMLPGLFGQGTALIGQGVVHARDQLLDLGDRFCRPGHLVPERLAVRPRLLGSPERLRAVVVRVGHDGRVPLLAAVLPSRDKQATREARGRIDRLLEAEAAHRR